MIRYKQGNLLDSNAEALVNTVNTVGVMGKGLALMFKQRFAQNMREYVAACDAGDVKTGAMFITRPGELIGPKWIVNFPTKQHWRNPSQMTWIVEGLRDLRGFIVENNVRSIAIPPLGAGNGGLQWMDVCTEIQAALKDLDSVDIQMYHPLAT